MQGALVNLSFYRFVPLENLPQLREKLRTLGSEFGLLGTILLAPEGVNVMLTGSEASVAAFEKLAKSLFGEYPAKRVPVEQHSFHRFLVKLKKEIISVGDPNLKPHLRTAKRLAPADLKKWYEEGKPFRILDTRNDYEMEIGTFKDAETLHLDASSEFAAKAKLRISEWRDLPLVTFCTGGIRCEKASAFLLEQGLEDVYQLDGGILRYFQENGSAFYDGSCFVYDWRLAVDGTMQPVARSEDPKKSFGRHKISPPSNEE
jgi:UPF0176 protein